MSDVPKIGDHLSANNCEMMYEMIQEHQRKFPHTPYIISFTLILMNAGIRYTPLECQEGEWTGIIADVGKATDGEYRCPNGHIVHKGLPLKLAWLT